MNHHQTSGCQRAARQGLRAGAAIACGFAAAAAQASVGPHAQAVAWTARWPMLLAALGALLALSLGAVLTSRMRSGAGVARGSAAAHSAWSQLTERAADFFDLHGLVSEQAAASWREGGALVLRKGERRYLLHARHWKATRVDAPAVYELMRDVQQRGAEGGILLCARDAFTPVARQLARQNGMLLLDATQLHAAAPRQATKRPPARGQTPSPPASTPAAPQALRATPEPAKKPPTASVAPPRPQLRPDDAIRGPRPFMPTVPMDPADLSQLDQYGARG